MVLFCSFFNSTIGRKVLMAVTGLVLVLFVMGHMLGNLQIFLGAEVINAYAYKLHHVLPTPALWGIRLFLLLCVGVHVWMAVLLTLASRRARPAGYAVKRVVQATYAARTMRMSGIILLAFIFFHLAHFTTRSVPGMEYNDERVLSPNEVSLVKHGQAVMKDGEKVTTFNVHDMMVAGFENGLVSAFYILATGLLCLHLVHGVSSMFQTLGLRNATWLPRLNYIARFYGWAVFLGFAIIPIAVLTGVLEKDPTGGETQAIETSATH
ncbi:MAG: Uncharacterised protein [Opitutia bacterium UBA7350]|nr:MAG: Uncharacterised protein [Opitutae bacterium UBA7350]